MEQTAGSVTAVTITPKSGKSSGAITKKYNGSATIPQAVGQYAVTFDVAAAAGWNAASGLSAGVLTVDPTGETKESAITLTENKWKNGSFAADGEQWFKFTATAAEQYIHFYPGTLNFADIQVYDSNGSAVGRSDVLWGINLSMNRTVTSNSVYYIKVKPWANSNKSGAYKIAFNASTTPPPITLPTSGVTTLTYHIWADGTITTGGEQWFSFTATANTQYLHFDLGTLNDVNVQVYDSTGAAIGGRVNLYGSTLSMNRTVTVNSEYHIKVTPYSGNGTYKIAFNASSTKHGA